MEVTEKIIDELAKLARLQFDSEKKTSIKKDMEKMLSFVEKINEVNTDGVEPLIHMSAEINRVREDVSKVTVTKEEALKNAPQKDSDFFKIPKVLR